jgi:hypothetical protein
MSAPVTDGKSWTHHRAVLAVSVRDGNHEAAEQARRAMRLAQTEHAIRTAIERAPPLDAATLARIRALIPPAPARST